MGRMRSPERDRARKIYLREKGKIAPRAIAAELGIKPELVRKWKNQDQWEAELKKPHRGGQAGNKNAEGHGAPRGNQNSVTHGAYATPRLDAMTEEQRRSIEEIVAEFDGNAARELQRLEAKRLDLENRIAALRDVPEDKDEAIYVDRKTVVKLPGSAKMEYLSKSSAFTRRMTLEAELNKVDGRIIKLLDSIRAAQAEGRRMELDRDRLRFHRERAMGAFSVPEEQDGDEEDDGDGGADIVEE